MKKKGSAKLYGECKNRKKEKESFLTDRVHALQRHNTEISKQIFPEKELRGHSPNFHIKVSVSDLNISTIDLPILLQENMSSGPILGIYKSLTDT